MRDVTSRANCVRIELAKNEQGVFEFFGATTDADDDERGDFNYQRLDLTENERVEVLGLMRGLGLVYIFSREYLELF